jgi:hypothetical protein
MGRYGFAISRLDLCVSCQKRRLTALQIVEEDPSTSKEKAKGKDADPTTLVEIGPRFVLTPIRIFEGAFSGATVFSNPGITRPLTVDILVNLLIPFTRIRFARHGSCIGEARFSRQVSLSQTCTGGTDRTETGSGVRRRSVVQAEGVRMKLTLLLQRCTNVHRLCYFPATDLGSTRVAQVAYFWHCDGQSESSTLMLQRFVGPTGQPSSEDNGK